MRQLVNKKGTLHEESPAEEPWRRSDSEFPPTERAEWWHGAPGESLAMTRRSSDQ